MSDICDVFKLTMEDCKDIFRASSQNSRKAILLSALGIERLDEEDDLRKSIVADLCLELISFASYQGFSWENVHRVMLFGMSLLDETACKGKELSDALEVFGENITKAKAEFKGFETKAIIDHFLSTFFRHYHLYLFCMTKDRELDQRVCKAEIETPFAVDELSKGVDIEKWNYQQSMKKIEDEKESLQKERLDTLKSKMEHLDEDRRDTLNQLEEMYENENDTELPSILERLTKLHIDSMQTEIQNSVQDSRENMELRMKRAMIAKPSSMKLRPVSRQRPKSKQKK